jgi:hypothetical protein
MLSTMRELAVDDVRTLSETEEETEQTENRVSYNQDFFRDEL